MRHLYMGLIVPATILVPIIMTLSRYRMLSREIKVLFYYLLVTMLIYIVSSTLALTHHNNIFIIDADTIIESIFLLRFFQLSLKKGDRRWVGWLMLVFPALCCLNLAIFQGPSQYNSYTRPVECILILSLSCLYWWRQGITASWSGVAMNWIVSGLILYFSSAFFLFLCSNLLMNYGLSVNELAWNLHATMILIMYLLFAIGISKYHS